MSPGEKRRRKAKREREAAAYAAALAKLPQHATCASCKHVDRVHHKPKLSCLLESDFYGDLLVTPEHRCPDWKMAADVLHVGPAVMFMAGCGGREPTHQTTTVRVKPLEK